MTNQLDNKTRPLIWDDDPPAEARVRRIQQDAPLPGRVRRSGPGMPLEFQDPEEKEDLRSERMRFSTPRGLWWRPSTKAGRIILGGCVAATLASCVTVVVITRHFLERDARFRIAGSQNIEAAGLVEVDRTQMLPVFGEDLGRNIFFVPLDLRRKQLEQIPWVEHATVMRLLPDHLQVSVVERTPVAFTRHGQQIDLVDANGVILNMLPATMAQHHYSFPVVTGIDPGDSADARKGRMATYERLMAELDAGGKKNSEQISEIDLTDPEDARVLMPEQGSDILAHFGEDHFLERYERYQAHIGEWRQQYPHLASVDLRYDEQVILQMASGTETSASNDSSVPKAPNTSPAADTKSSPGASASGAARHTPVTKRSNPVPQKKNSLKHAAVKAARRSATRPSTVTVAHNAPGKSVVGATSMAEGGN